MSTDLNRIREGLTSDKLEELAEEHGRIYQIDFGDEEDERVPVVFRWAKPAEMKRFQAAVDKDSTRRRAASKDLANDVLVYPSRQDVEKIAEVYTLVYAAVTNETIELQAGAAPDRAKKVRLEKKTG